MFSFNDFNIKPKTNHFTGKKVDLSEVLNLKIIVHGFKIEPSKKKAGTQLLTLQIEVDNVKRVIFSGSTILQQMIQEVDPKNFPFQTTIVKRGEFPEFT